MSGAWVRATSYNSGGIVLHAVPYEGVLTPTGMSSWDGTDRYTGDLHRPLYRVGANCLCGVIREGWDVTVHRRGTAATRCRQAAIRRGFPLPLEPIDWRAEALNLARIVVVANDALVADAAVRVLGYDDR